MIDTHRLYNRIPKRCFGMDAPNVLAIGLRWAMRRRLVVSERVPFLLY